MKRKIYNYMSFYIGWTACLYGAAKGWPYIGPAMVALFAAVHLYIHPEAKKESVWILGVSVLGCLGDTLVVAGGVFSYAQPFHNTFITPLWYVSIWVLFATTLRLSLRWILESLPIAILFGLVGGPLSFYVSARIGAIDFQKPIWISLVVLGIAWSIYMGLFSLAITNKWLERASVNLRKAAN